MNSKFYTHSNRKNECNRWYSTKVDPSQTHKAIHLYCDHQQNESYKRRCPDVEQHYRHNYKADSQSNGNGDIDLPP